MIDREELERLHEAATKGDLTTAEFHTERGWMECPFCGDGEIEATDYCNFDDVALGVQFYGIGKEFGAHEALWSYLRNAVPDILKLMDERDTLAAENAALTEKVERLEEALSNVEGYSSDTLTGRADGSADQKWYRDGFRVILKIVRAALKGEEG